MFTKENNPHTNPALARKSAKKTAAPANAPLGLYHKGIKQFGDVKLYGKNPEIYFKQKHAVSSIVGPGDIVDDVSPEKRYTFYLYRLTSNLDDSASELDRLRRDGWFKCEAPRFISLSGKFETKDNALILGSGVWYACPETRWLANRKEAREDTGPRSVADHHAALARDAKKDGMSATAETRNDSRGQRDVD